MSTYYRDRYSFVVPCRVLRAKRFKSLILYVPFTYHSEVARWVPNRRVVDIPKETA